jgi:hypothetical protein
MDARNGSGLTAAATAHEPRGISTGRQDPLNFHTEAKDRRQAPTPDWARIKTDFAAGALSVREIARREGVSDTAIHKRATSEGWDPGLRQPVNPCLPGLQTEPQTKPTDAAEIGRTVERALASTAHPLPADDFEWSACNPDVLVWDRPSLAVYLNPMQQIVIRAEANGDDDDAFIRLDRRDVPMLIRRLEELGR